ncbi:MAG: hypothetical protein ACI81I_000079 [Arcobacteraceae bacterium]|jgi:hypothetical protein
MKGEIVAIKIIVDDGTTEILQVNCENDVEEIANNHIHWEWV